MTAFDLIGRNVRLADGRSGLDIGARAGRIAAVERGLPAGGPEVDAADNLVSPPFVDAHYHMDTGLSIGHPRHNESGTLLEGIRLWGRPSRTSRRRSSPSVRCAIATGRSGAVCWRSAATSISAIRACSRRTLLEVRRKVAPYLDLQLVAFPQDGYLRNPEARRLFEAALDRGVDIVGGIPHFERTMAEGAESVRLLCELAAKRGLPVDMHCDESDDPLSRHVESLAAETVRCGLQGRVTGSHLTSTHSMDNYYVSKLIPLMVEARLNVIANPLINITCRAGTTPTPSAAA